MKPTLTLIATIAVACLLGGCKLENHDCFTDGYHPKSCYEPEVLREMDNERIYRHGAQDAMHAVYYALCVKAAKAYVEPQLDWTAPNGFCCAEEFTGKSLARLKHYFRGFTSDEMPAKLDNYVKSLQR